MGERFMTLVPYASEPVEVELDHWFRQGDERWAVVSTVNGHGEYTHHVRHERHLEPIPPSK